MNYYFILTTSCSYHCNFCIRENISATSQGDMNFESFKKVAEMLHDAHPRSVIILTGGEPTMHPYFKNIVDYALCLFDKVCITSNGSFSEDISNFLSVHLSDNLSLQISIDGVKEVHDKMRGMQAFDNAIENINRLQHKSEYLVISTTVGRNNINAMKDLAMYLNRLKFHHWKVSQEQVVCPTRDNIIQTMAWNKLVDTLLPLCFYRVHIKKMFAFDIWDDYIGTYENDFYDLNRNCGIGKNKIYVNPQFDVLPCTCICNTVGNLLTDSFFAIESHLKNLSNIAPDENSVCYTCKYKNICNGGCPGYSLKYYGKANMGDLRCPLLS